MRFVYGFLARYHARRALQLLVESERYADGAEAWLARAKTQSHRGSE